MLSSASVEYNSGRERRVVGSNLSPRPRSLRPHQLRREADEEVTISIANTGSKLGSARRLVNDRYGQRGYGRAHQLPTGSHRSTFTAERSGKIVGTITLAADSPAGLAADRTFRDELDRFRKGGHKICELTKFAFASEIRSHDVMAALFHVVYVYGLRMHSCTDLFIEVNPRHVRFYEIMLGFERIGSPRQNASVDAPAQLMWLRVSNIGEQIDLAACEGAGRGRSLYRRFFSPTEEKAVFERLMCGGWRAARDTTSRSASSPATVVGTSRISTSRSYSANGARARSDLVGRACG